MPHSLRILPSLSSDHRAILSEPALDLVAQLTRQMRPRVQQLLAARQERQARFDRGERPRFLPETEEVRRSDWQVAPLPHDLLDRRVEITGPVDRKMIINALNSGAKVFMADFEDSSAPTFDNMVLGQRHLRDAVRRTISFRDEGRGKDYHLVDNPAVLMVRPRGWHLWEKHVLVDGEPVPAGIFDFALYMAHNAAELRTRGTGPYFYLPKMQSHLEARLWNDVFVAAQRALDLPQRTIKATVLIETLPAAFELDEILYELRDHSAGLNCGRWDYIFSTIKTLREDPSWVLPDRGQVGMTQPFMSAYSHRVIQVCHRRGVHAMGGMAAQIPIKNDPAANEAALAKVRADKEREVKAGHDGTWVAHPALVPVAMEIFSRHMSTPHQLHVRREDLTIAESDLLQPPTGTRTEAGLRQNLNVGVLYLEAWLRGSGCVPLYNLMEDAATAEISRTQIWQWLHHRAELDDGRAVTPEFVRSMLDEEMEKIRAMVGDAAFNGGKFPLARRLFEDVALSDDLQDFLTLPAYEQILVRE